MVCRRHEDYCGVAITTDGHRSYLEARRVRCRHRLRYAGQDLWNAPEGVAGRYSPAECTGAIKTRIEGKPDLKHVITSYVFPPPRKSDSKFSYRFHS
jgi:hypothetical protein